QVHAADAEASLDGPHIAAAVNPDHGIPRAAHLRDAAAWRQGDVCPDVPGRVTHQRVGAPSAVKTTRFGPGLGIKRPSVPERRAHLPALPGIVVARITGGGVKPKQVSEGNAKRLGEPRVTA